MNCKRTKKKKQDLTFSAFSVFEMPDVLKIKIQFLVKGCLS